MKNIYFLAMFLFLLRNECQSQRYIEIYYTTMTPDHLLPKLVILANKGDYKITAEDHFKFLQIFKLRKKELKIVTGFVYDILQVVNKDSSKPGEGYNIEIEYETKMDDFFLAENTGENFFSSFANKMKLAHINPKLISAVKNFNQ